MEKIGTTERRNGKLYCECGAELAPTDSHWFHLVCPNRKCGKVHDGARY